MHGSIFFYIYNEKIINFYNTTLKPKPKINIEKTQIKIIKKSFQVKSTGNLSWFFKFKPKTTLNQHLLKPIKPKKFAAYIINIVVNGAEQIKPENI